MIGLFRPADTPFACDDVGVDTVGRMPMIDMMLKVKECKSKRKERERKSH